MAQFADETMVLKYTDIPYFQDFNIITVNTLYFMELQMIC